MRLRLGEDTVDTAPVLSPRVYLILCKIPINWHILIVDPAWV
jgi:hypothetical protein